MKDLNGLISYLEAAQYILDYYGQKKQEIQAVQELTELNLLLVARPDQRKEDYVQNITKEIADVQVMLMQLRLMHGITREQIDDVIKEKLLRQLDRIDKEREGGTECSGENAMNNTVYSGMKTSPCKDCTARQIGCHGTCEPHMEFRRYRDTVKAEQYRQREAAEYFIENARKQAQKRRRKKQ